MDKKIIFGVAFAYMLILLFSEVVVVLHSPEVGVLMHSLLILYLVVCSSAVKEKKFSNILKVLALPPLIRIVWASLPLAVIKHMYWLLAVYMILFLASYLLIRNQGKDIQWAGIVFNKPAVQLMIALTGVLFGIIEYFILSPPPMISALVIGAPLVPPLTFIMFLSFVEELIFRGIIQTNAVKLMGESNGILFVSVIFAIMHLVWQSALDLAFVFGVSLFYGYAFLKTRSIIGVSLSHGIANVFLFLVLPFAL